jgi:hypothetical protein
MGFDDARTLCGQTQLGVRRPQAMADRVQPFKHRRFDLLVIVTGQRCRHLMHAVDGERFDASLRFNRGWQSVTAQVGHEFAAHYDFSGVSHLPDVGGNRGVILAPVLRNHPHLCATLFDLSASMVGADADLTAAGVRDRITIVEGETTLTMP